MNEDNNIDQHTEEQQPSDKTQIEYREISEDELKQIIEDHKKWLESDGKEGEQPNLSFANLQEVDFTGINLQRAMLVGANLKLACFVQTNLQWANLGGANLLEAGFSSANLQNAYLGEANLQKAYLYDANLQNATLWEANLQMSNLNKSNFQNADLDGIKGLNKAENLQYANFQGATGLLGNEFAQADVTGTKLPDDIKEFKTLEIVEKTSQNARKIFFAMLLVCVYSWLTIATTTDVRLLTNTASSPLPIIQTEIPIAWFYIAAPLVLICLYFYFHLYLDNLWEGLASLPAIFPDGKRLDQRAYPWLLNTLVRRHFKRLKTRPLIARMKEWITIFLAWWIVPITMIAFWLRFIPRHDWWGTSVHIILIIFSFGFAIYFYRMCALTLKGNRNPDQHIQIYKYLNNKTILNLIIAAFFGLLFLIYSVFTFNYFGANFSEKEVSEKPVQYWQIPENDLPKYVKGANLKGRNLKNANMWKAFLVNADLRQAVVESAKLKEARLQDADLKKANLQDANLKKAKLQKARLFKANLQNADLTKANLQDADLSQANLREARLFKANLQNADLKKANLQGANLSFADLTGAEHLTIDQMSKVKTLYQAKLGPELLEQVKKCCPHLLEKPKEETEKNK